MKHSDSITSIQFIVIIMGTMIGISMLSLPRIIVEKAEIAAPIAGSIGIAISLIGFVGLIYLGRRFPKLTFIGYSHTILGKVIGNFFMIPFLLAALILFAFETRQFAEVLVGGLLPNTPIQVSIFAMVVLCAAINFSNVSTFAYIHFFYLPLILLPLLLVLLPSFKDIELYHLLPITGHNVTFIDLMGGALAMMGAISNYFVIAFIIPYLKKPKDEAKYGIWGFVIGALVVLFIVILSLAVFGEVKIIEMAWPTLVLARMVEVPGEILARIDAIFIISWIFATFTTLLSYYFIFVRGIAEILKVEKYRLIAALGIPLAILIAQIPDDTYDIYTVIIVSWRVSVIFYILYVLLLIVIAKIRRKKGSV